MWLGFAEVEKGRQGNRDIDFLAVLATLEKFIFLNLIYYINLSLFLGILDIRGLHDLLLLLQ